MKSLVTIGLGIFIAFVILSFAAPPKVSTYSRNIDAWPLTLDDSNLALIGVGLESRAPAPPSVMDASPASSAKPVMMMKVSPAPAPVMMMAPAAHVPVMMMAPAAPAPVMMMAPAPSSALPMSSTMTPVSMKAPSPSS